MNKFFLTVSAIASLIISTPAFAMGGNTFSNNLPGETNLERDCRILSMDMANWINKDEELYGLGMYAYSNYLELPLGPSSNFTVEEVVVSNDYFNNTVHLTCKKELNDKVWIQVIDADLNNIVFSSWYDEAYEEFRTH